MAQRSGKVTVVGAGFYGSTTAQRLAEFDVFETVVLTDIVEGKGDFELEMAVLEWNVMVDDRRRHWLNFFTAIGLRKPGFARDQHRPDHWLSDHLNHQSGDTRGCATAVSP